MKALIIGLVALSAACGRTGQREVTAQLVAIGTPARDVVVGDVTVRLTEATLAVGPLYFCATQAASSSLCSVAVAEMRETVVINGLNDTEQRLGTIEGVTGTIKSAQYDLGISWFGFQQQPAPTSSAMGEHSLSLRGEATRGAVTVPFYFELDFVPVLQDQRFVQGARCSGVLTKDGQTVHASVDPNAWVSQGDWSQLFDADATTVPNAGLRDAIQLQVSVNAALRFSF